MLTLNIFQSQAQKAATEHQVKFISQKQIKTSERYKAESQSAFTCSKLTVETPEL